LDSTQAALLKRVRSWDQDALTQVYDEYAPALYRYAYRLTGHRETAQEIVSETFHRFLLALKRGGGPDENLRAWLYRVAHNLVIDQRRRQPPLDPLPIEEAPDVAVHEAYDERVIRREMVAQARAALQHLTSLQQQVVALRFLEGLSNEEVAEIVGRNVGAVKALQHRALNALRRILEGDDGD